jgi:hypothetical protein
MNANTKRREPITLIEDPTVEPLPHAKLREYDPPVGGNLTAFLVSVIALLVVAVVGLGIGAVALHFIAKFLEIVIP